MRVCHITLGCKTGFPSILAVLFLLVMSDILFIKSNITKDIQEFIKNGHSQKKRMQFETLLKQLKINETESKVQRRLKLSLQNSSMKLEEQIKRSSGSCLNKMFSDLLLVIIYHFPYYESFPYLREFYKVAFESIIICGPTSTDKYPSIQVDFQNGYYAYQCLADAIVKYPGFQGYLYVNDDMIVNWWNFKHFSKSEMWLGAQIERGVEIGKPPPSTWMWWSNWLPGMKTCEDSIQEITQIVVNNSIPWMKEALNNHLHNHRGKRYCRKGWSDFFYIPGRLADKFQTISSIFYKHKVFLEIAVPTILTFLNKETEIEIVQGFFLPSKYGFLDFSNGDKFWTEYNFKLYFIHPFKFHSGTRFSKSLFETFVVPYSNKQGYTC